MVDYFDQPIAVDPTGNDGTGTLVPNAEFEVFAGTDLSFTTPLAVYEAVSGAEINPLVSSSVGQLPQFRVEGDPEFVILKSGQFEVRLRSVFGAAKQAVSDAGLSSEVVQEVLQAKDDVEGLAADVTTAVGTATDAATAAGDFATAASTAASDAQTSKEAVQAVVATSDGIMAPILASPTTASGAALRATIAEFARGAQQRVDAAVAKLDMRVLSTFTCAIASDSTGDGTNEWYELAWQSLFASLWPERPARVIRWNKANDAYIAPIIWQTAETPAVPPSGEVSHPNTLIAQDAFNSASPVELNGRSPDVGKALTTWTSTPGAFKVASGMIYATATSGSGFNCYFTPADRSGIDIHTKALIRFNTTPTAAQRSVGLYGAYITSANRVLVTLTRPTTGSCTLILSVSTTGGGSRTLATFPVGTIPENTIGEYPFAIDIAGTSVSATVNGVTLSGTLTADEVTALTGSSRVGFVASVANDPEFAVKEFEARGTVVTPANPGSPAVPSIYPYATVYNPSAAGTTAAYQLARLDAMYPVRPDMLMIAHGHNYGADSPEVYLAALDAFVTAFLAKYPDVPVWVVSQNPEFPPATGADNSAAHNARQVALRGHALKRGWVYLPAFEAFAKRSDGGKSYVNSDGVHPAQVGQNLWRDAAVAGIKAHSRRP